MSETAPDTNKKINYALTGVSIMIIGIVIVLSFVYYNSSCDIETCDNLPDTLSYGESVAKLEQIIMNGSEENKNKFIKNFFSQLKNTCVSA